MSEIYFKKSKQVANSLTIQFNGEQVSSFDGSNASTINITPSGIGAAVSSHTHGIASTSANGFLKQLDGSTSHFMRGDGVWATPTNATIDLSLGTYVLIGDSYLAGLGATTNWGKELVSMLNIPSSRYTINAKPGAGFNVAGNTFISLLDESTSPTGNNSDVTHVIVAGGYNDDNNTSGLYAAITDFISECKSKYSNCKIYISYIANNVTTPYETLGNALGYYCDAAVRNGANFINNVYLMLNYTGVVQNDGFHPNNSGQKRIAGALINGLNGQSVSSSQVPSMINFVSPGPGVSNIHSNGTNNYQVNDKFIFNTFGFGANLDWTDNWNGVTLHDFCSMSGNYFYGCNGNQTSICVPSLVSADGFWCNASTSIIFNCGKIKLSIQCLRSDGTNFYNGHLSEIIIPRFTFSMDFLRN